MITPPQPPSYYSFKRRVKGTEWSRPKESEKDLESYRREKGRQNEIIREIERA
jgi:hypothetical protein